MTQVEVKNLWMNWEKQFEITKFNLHYNSNPIMMESDLSNIYVIM